MYDIAKIRSDFPILSRKVHGKPLVYFDNGASAQKPKAVIDTIERAYSDMEEEGFQRDEVTIRYILEMRYGGQLHEVVVRLVGVLVGERRLAAEPEKRLGQLGD